MLRIHKANQEEVRGKIREGRSGGATVNTLSLEKYPRDKSGGVAGVEISAEGVAETPQRRGWSEGEKYRNPLPSTV
jgi:hypothetical protein